MTNYVANFDRLYQTDFSPSLMNRSRLGKHPQQVLNDAVKMCGLITLASKGTHIQEAISKVIQTVSRDLVCVLELQINTWWTTRPGHFVMLNACTLRETQRMTQQTLLAIAHALYEGNPQPVRTNNEELSEIILKLRQLMKEQGDDSLAGTLAHGYVWLSIGLARRLELLLYLTCRALRKQAPGAPSDCMGRSDSATFRVVISAKEETLSSATASSYASPITQPLHESESRLLGV